MKKSMIWYLLAAVFLVVALLLAEKAQSTAAIFIGVGILLSIGGTVAAMREERK